MCSIMKARLFSLITFIYVSSLLTWIDTQYNMKWREELVAPATFQMLPSVQRNRLIIYKLLNILIKIILNRNSTVT